MISKAKLSQINGPLISAKRNELEHELGTIAPLNAQARKLLSMEGFIDFFLTMREYYACDLDAYECLESHYERIVGRRKYADLNSFRNLLNRYLDSYKKPVR